MKTVLSFILVNERIRQDLHLHKFMQASVVCFVYCNCDFFFMMQHVSCLW